MPVEQTNQELKKSFRVELIDNSIIDTEFLVLYGDRNNGLRQAEMYRNAVFASIDKVKGNGLLNATVDLHPLEHTNIVPTSEAGKVYSETARHPRIDRIALIGLKPFYKAIAKLILMAAHKGDSIKKFDTREEALDWLKSF